MPRPHPARSNLLYTVITGLFALVVLELGLHAIDWAASRVKKSPEKIPWRGLYQGQEWAPALAKESDSRTQAYHQYLTWISKPKEGRFVNIDGAAGRKTWNPPDLKTPEVKVFVFGGSAAWGYGARDDYTIASQLSRRLNAREPRFRVYNFGEPGYTFTQGLFLLITKLQEGLRPNFVIFYDGFNDVYGAYQSGQPGTLHNVAQVRHKLESKPRELYWQAVRTWFQENIYLYNRVYLSLFPPEKKFREAGAGMNDQELKGLAAGLVQYYARSQELLDRLAQAYGFKYACFWQPALFTEARVLPQETRVDPRLEDKNFARLYQFTNQYLAEHPLPKQFHNLNEVLSQRLQPCYVDLVHLTEGGYDMVAERMYTILQEEFSLRE